MSYPYSPANRSLPTPGLWPDADALALASGPFLAWSQFAPSFAVSCYSFWLLCFGVG
jgi:hypothetical protein